MIKEILKDKLAQKKKVEKIQFEFNKRFENFRMTPKERELIDQYLYSSNSFTLAYLEHNCSTPELKIKYEYFKNNIVPDYKPIPKSELEIFDRLINSQQLDRSLMIYRGTSKLHFSLTHIINDDPSLGFNNLKPGDKVETLTSLSTSLDPFLASDFCCGSIDTSLIAEYNPVTSDTCFWANPYGDYHEKEFIIPPKQIFYVDEIDYLDSTITKPSKIDSEGIHYIKLRR